MTLIPHLQSREVLTRENGPPGLSSRTAVDPVAARRFIAVRLISCHSSRRAVRVK